MKKVILILVAGLLLCSVSYSETDLNISDITKKFKSNKLEITNSLIKDLTKLNNFYGDILVNCVAIQNFNPRHDACKKAKKSLRKIDKLGKLTLSKKFTDSLKKSKKKLEENIHENFVKSIHRLYDNLTQVKVF